MSTVTEAELTFDVPFRVKMARDDYVHGKQCGILAKRVQLFECGRDMERG